jgi:hypothetical protein
MPITFYKNEDGVFKNVSGETSLKKTSGWWNSIIGGDFDNDGDTDYVLGNVGENIKYRTSPDEPTEIFYNDFDGNGKKEAILSYYNFGKKYPTQHYNRMIEQMPDLEKKYTNYSQYASATLEDMFSEKLLNESVHFEAHVFSNCYMENRRNDGFELKKLAPAAQVSPIYGMSAVDINGDGNLDVVCHGNLYGTEDKTYRMDAGTGLCLIGDGHGNFAAHRGVESGFLSDEDSKGLAVFVKSPNATLGVLAASSNGRLKTFEAKEIPLKTISVNPTDFYAEIQFKSGEIQRQEFYFGSGYLSGSSRNVAVTSTTTQVTIVDFDGKKRIVFGGE